MESQEPKPLTTQSGRLVKTKKDNNFVYTGTKKVENDIKVQDTLPVEPTPEKDTSERNENSDTMSVVPTSENNTSETNESSDTSVATANYALNLEKTLDKKIDACDRLPIEAMHSETNSVITFSTTAFDLAQKCTAQYFSCDSYTIKHNQKQDKRGLIESDVMRISNKRNAFTITINFYRTTSKALINGAGLKTFQETHLPAMEEMIKMDYNRSEEQSVKYKVLGAKEELANLKPQMVVHRRAKHTLQVTKTQSLPEHLIKPTLYVSLQWLRHLLHPLVKLQPKHPRQDQQEPSKMILEIRGRVRQSQNH